MRATPVSTTYRMPGTVSDVSATLVASTIRRPVWDWKTRCCSAAESREYSGTISTVAARRSTLSRPRAPSSASRVSRISRSPGRKTRMSPGPSAESSLTASTIASVWSRTIGSPSSSASGSSTSGR